MSEAVRAQRELRAGDYAPDFTLDDDSGKSIVLSELRGKNVVVYFYPKDDTPGCTLEGKDFSNLQDDFEDANTLVFGISRDNLDSHRKFKEKCDLSVSLLADNSGTVCEAYSVWVEKNMYGKKYMGIQRDTFLIDKKGMIKRVWNKVKVEGHAKEVLEEARKLG